MPYESNPYNKFKPKKKDTEREILSESEIFEIENLKYDEAFKNIRVVRDMFLYSCYTGLRYSDLQAIKQSDFHIANESVYMSLSQEKTDKPVDIPLHILFDGKALKIYERYKSTEKDAHIFPRMTNQAANRLLKLIAISAGISKPLTFHIGRHTFGTMIAKHTGDQFLIKTLMGHSDIKTSQIYIHLSKKHIEDKLKNVKW